MVFVDRGCCRLDHPPLTFRLRGEGLLRNLHHLRAADAKQLVWINCEHRVWRSACGKDLIELEQVGVQ